MAEISHDGRSLSDDQNVGRPTTAHQVEPVHDADAGIPVVSVVIPAYNESGRITPYLQEIEEYFGRRREDYEVVVVDDGSHDRTAEVVREWGTTRPWLRLVRHEHNHGKGCAVRAGMVAARGALRLMADADGATPIEEIERLRAQMPKDSLGVAVGSRALRHSSVRRVVKRHRQVMGTVFSALKRSVLGLQVADSQCGFKLFTAPAAEALFGASRVDGFAFDVEILYLAAKARIPVVEVAVSWHDVGESHVRLLSDSLKMALDLWRIRRLHRNTVVTWSRHNVRATVRAQDSSR